MKIEKSKFDGWNTPKKIINCVVDVLGGIDLDPCSNEFSIVPATHKLGKAENGLAARWHLYGRNAGADKARVYCNPPYDQKTLEATTDQIVAQFNQFLVHTISLVPSKTDQAWFHKSTREASAMCFLKGRVPFGKGGVFKGGGQFACTAFYFGQQEARFKEVFAQLGACV